ncbi:MAG: YihY/virulence factor BrkB family protein [Bacteroidetes bacterium]|nr:YihY/virulence factor BrkB family protein [Bacteroidota bacterium]
MRIFKYVKQVFAEFSADNIFKYSASLAYYTVFSVAPLLVIIISLSGFLFGREAIEGQVYAQLNHLIGSVAAMQIQDTIKNIHLTGNSLFASILSIVILLIGATSIFGEIQDSLNKIWGLRVKTKKIWWKLILTRLLSFSLILSIGFIVIITLLLNTLVNAFGDFITRFIKGYSIYFIEITESVLSFVVSAILFSLLFKILPDAKIKWKDVLIGGLVTALFFTLGKMGIGYYLAKSNVGTLYGAAGSVIIFMLWVYYSSVILYLGAEFTKVYAKLYGGKIIPNEYAEWVMIQEENAATSQLKNKELP